MDELATGTGNLSDRLYEAAYYVLRIQPDEIPSARPTQFVES